ncbi:MAG: diguanylate cyclase [Actinomycetota bacterium]|nr:diguanylate cyclase [Actinomycetota bacterium]
MAPDDTVAALRASEALLAAALDSVSEGSLVTDANRRIIYCNRTFTSMTGFGIADLLGENCRILQGPDTDSAVLAEIRHALNSGMDFSGRLLNYRRDGTEFWNQLTISPIRDVRGAITNFVSVQRDVTSEVKLERDLRRQAGRDALTGLPLRSVIFSNLKDSIDEARATGTVVSLGVIDINGFTAINHEFGHNLGDRILREFADRLKSRTRVTDTLGRLGGGQFLVVVRGLDERLGAGHLRGIIERLLGAGIEPVSLSDSHRIPVGLSYGLSLWPADAQDGDGLLRVAETSLHHAKNPSLLPVEGDP